MSAMKALTASVPRAGARRPRRGPTATAEESRGVTIYEVAERARVSITTVSRVMRGSGPVSSETRERVLAAIDELSFTPSRLGRALAERRHAANGIVFPDLSGPYYAEVVLGYEEVAGELGRSVLILSTHGRRDAREMVLDLASRVDGLVILGRTVEDRVVHEVAATGLPVVLLARPPVAGVDSVNAENSRAAGRLAEHLLGHGRERLVFIGDPDQSPDVAERWSGVSAVLADRGLPPSPPVRCGFDERCGYEEGRRLLTGPRPPDALVCANDEIALGALLAAEEAGLRVPEDVAVTGWDDVMAAKYSRPALTTVRQPMRELGARAARALDERINAIRDAPRHELLPTELVVRTSCGPHPKEES
jgi:LacI family transcriptional regulator